MAVCNSCARIMTLTRRVLQYVHSGFDLASVCSLLGALTAYLNLRLVVRLAHAVLSRVVLLARRQGRYLRRLLHAIQVISDQ